MGSLRKFLSNHGPLNENLTRRYTRQLLEGVKYLHSRNIVHRDIKGDNVLRDSKGNIKIADFGTSKHLQTIHFSEAKANTFTGTWHWMAPEVFKCQPINTKSDIWSVGCTVFEMLTGKPPFYELSQYQLMCLITNDNHLDIQLPPHCSTAAHDFVASCLRKDVSSRPSAVELLCHEFVTSAAPKRVATEPADIRPQAASTIDSGKGAVTDAVLTDIKRTVCRIRSPLMVATGFIAYVKGKEGFNLALVTNNHVIRTADEAMASRITFENVFPDHKVTLKGFQIFLKEKNAFRCSRETELDYTIIEIDETKMKDPETGKRLDIEPIYLMYPADIRTDDQIYVIQHPRGGKLTFSPSQCTVIEPLLLYECTTDMGSSGSPVLKEVDGDLKIVALHRGGEYKQWNSDRYNCGTLIQEIVNHLNGKLRLRFPQRPMTSHHGMSSQYTQPTLRTPQDGIPQQPSSAFGREPHLIYQPSSTIGGGMGRVYDENVLESNVSSVSQDYRTAMFNARPPSLDPSPNYHDFGHGAPFHRHTTSLHQIPQRPMTIHHGMSSQYTQPTLRTPQDGILQQPSSAFGGEPHPIYQPSSTIGGGMGRVYDENVLESNVSSVAKEPADNRPQFALPIDRGKGAVSDAEFTDIKKTVCHIHAPQMVATGFIAYVRNKEGFNMALVTNNHVIKTAEDAMTSQIAFENVSPDRKVTLKGFQIFLKEKVAFRCSHETELDYTIIEIDETKMKDPETGKPLDIEPIHFMYPADIRTNDQIYVIQHPCGGKLTFTPSQCTVIEPLLLYECTTDMGSSGSPVLKEVDGDLKIVALHHGGEYKQWNSDGYNCGTLIQEILNHLNGQQCLRFPQRPMTSHHGMSSQYTQPTLRTPQDGIPQQPSSAFGREPHLIYQPSSTIGGRMGRVYDVNMLESNVSNISQEPADIQPQAALPIDSGKGAVTDAVLTDIERTVCRIHAPQMVATGFIAIVKSKEGLNMALVTNNHVLRTADDAMASRIAFENVFPDRKVTFKGFHIFFKEKDAFRCSRETELDYTIIEIDETKMKDPETGKRLDIEPIYLMYPADIRTDDQIYVIQHPRGDKLTFSPSQCTVIEPLLLYECTTDMGSSGSPVLKEVDGDLKIVALHHGGEYKQWNSTGYNRGTLIQEIVNHLNGQQCLGLPTRDQVQQALRRR
ncbi:uncharacterized protein [Dysidea avara]|uniref:uncharacterized protein isoform X3 n=1 Tax=Dysidea avara TaxID=196820 RepID=UPI00332E9800